VKPSAFFSPFAPLQHQEVVGKHDERHVVMPASPTSRLVLIHPEFLFPLLEALLDRPA
jgi:hypothetical protein